MVMYDNEFETQENKFKPRIKLNHKTYLNFFFRYIFNKLITGVDSRPVVWI